MMVLEEVYKDIQNSFGKLWACKVRGQSLEIITPFATTSQRFVSVFLTKRHGEFIVTDGGWIGEGVYDNLFERDEEAFLKILLHYQSSFEVKETEGPAERPFFYKKTRSSVAVPSILFDLASFISAIVSTSAIEFVDKAEKENKIRFSKQANSFLQTIIPKENLKLGAAIDKRKQIRVNAIIKKSPSKIVLINYITGSNFYFFNNSVSKTNFVFELAAKAEEHIFIDSTICLIDDLAEGYVPLKVQTYLKHLEENTKSKMVRWSNKERLLQNI